jgi:endogenous inhibitor of DNA gyrase (YacG/DUF329 family)
MSTVKCPICGSPFEFEKSDAAPFCSARCRQIDLKRWLGEEYCVPVVRSTDEVDDEAVFEATESDSDDN